MTTTDEASVGTVYSLLGGRSLEVNRPKKGVNVGFEESTRPFVQPSKDPSSKSSLSTNTSGMHSAVVG